MDFNPELDYNAEIEVYRRSKKRLQQIDTSEYSDSEKAHINAMISNCEYAIQWLRTGHKPGPQRGVERLAGYQREKLVDPLIMQSYVQRGAMGSPTTITDGERQRIDDALATLSPRERECYVMAHGECFSQYEIAQILGIPRDTVKTYIERAQKKVSAQYYHQISLTLVV